MNTGDLFSPSSPSDTASDKGLSPEDLKRRERLTRLSQDKENRKNHSPFRTKTIRYLRLILPLMAIALIAVILTWDNSEPVAPTDTQLLEDRQSNRRIQQNELTAPRFESVDNKNQPYTITAKRAVQNDSDENLVILEKPFADMLMKSGNWVALEAAAGLFNQDEQRLILDGNVQLFYDKGYTMQSPQLHINLKSKQAWSDKDIQINGPAGTLVATGMEANQTDENLIFHGPAKLVLKSDFSFSDPDKTGGNNETPEADAASTTATDTGSNSDSDALNPEEVQINE